MSLPYPIDPSLPSNPSPLFSDTTAARGDHLRANNSEIWANLNYIVSTILGDATLSTDFSSIVDTLFPSVKAVKDFIDSMFPPGIVLDYSGVNIPGTFWVNCNGNSYARASYPTCWTNLAPTLGTCTINQAAPAIVTINGHGLQSGACIAFLSTGSLPSPLAVETNYYVTVINGDTFKLSTSYTNYLAGTWITTTNAGSGVHTLRSNPWGIVDATHFNIPDTQGLSTEGAGQQLLAAWASAEYAGRLGQYRQDQMQGHYHQDYGHNAGGILTGFSGITNALSLGSAKTLITGAREAVSDGTNGTPRTGLSTYGPRVGINKMIRML